MDNSFSMQQIKSYFQSLVDLTEKDWEIFSSRLHKKEFPKKTILLKTGQIEKRLSFVEKGALRYYFEKEAYDITFEFSPVFRIGTPKFQRRL